MYSTFVQEDRYLHVYMICKLQYWFKSYGGAKIGFGKWVDFVRRWSSY